MEPVPKTRKRSVQRIGGRPYGKPAGLLHALAQQNIPQRARDDHHQDQQKRFKMQRFLRRHSFPAVKQQACQPCKLY